MKVSIITVCLNSEKTIEKTILSVLAQEYEDIEYIIIDGKSVDRTVDIIRKYEDRISIIVSEETGRISVAMQSELNYNLSLDDLKLLLLEGLQPKRETFYEVDMESEGEENEENI